MSIIVETGGGISNANSYSSVQSLMDYAELRHIKMTTFALDEKEAALIQATEWIDAHNFKYGAGTITQSLQFPRAYAFRLFRGSKFDGTFPLAIIEACQKAAILELYGLLRVDTSTLDKNGEITEQSSSLVTGMFQTVKYKAGTSQTYYRVLPTELTNLLSPFLAGSGAGTAMRI